MSARNGDKARTDRLKKRRTQRRMRSRELAASVPAKPQVQTTAKIEGEPATEKTA